MKKIILTITVFLTACGGLSSLPANQYPTLIPTPTLAVQTKPIEDSDRDAAYNFFYEMKNKMALGEYEHFAEEIRYPITVRVDGQTRTFVYVADFEVNFEKIFTEEQIQLFISTDEFTLEFTPNGVNVANGLVWFDLICLDPACEEAEFLITEINN